MCAYSSLLNPTFVGSLSVGNQTKPLTRQTVDHKLYAINKEDDVTSCSSNVFFLDCRTHTWVVEGLVDSASGRSVFLTKDLVEFGSACLIEKIYYCYGSTGEFLWSNNSAEVDGWKKVEGLEGLSKLARYSNVNLVDCSGKMVVFWDKYVPAGNKEKMIWCAEISLEMRSSGEQVWGKVEWFDALLKVPKSYKFVYSIAATLAYSVSLKTLFVCVDVALVATVLFTTMRIVQSL
ncbi:hypothetical protein YC2023_037587 [Brassica napus]